ncbi:MAG: endonuclease/exonuclease/phosphatase family protein [Chloroflexi bacterium]|nr:endonuclease/exonuclease/phosphatase family protein [Chloroflexota bacterium]
MKHLRRVGRAARIFAIGYGLFIALFLVLRLLVGERFWLVALFDALLPALFFPALALLLIGLITRHMRVMVAQFPALLGFMLLYSTVLLPPPTTAQPGDIRFGLLTYNVYSRNDSYSEIARIIREADAEIVLLQEVSATAAVYFEQNLADLYPQRVFYPHEGHAGQGALSRYPIVTQTYWQMELGHLRLEVQINDTPVVIYSLHPIHPFLLTRGLFNQTPQNAEIDDALARAAAESGAVVLAGDFNISDLSDAYERITASYGDAFRAEGGGLGLTFPAFFPLARLDYVFYNSAIVPVDARVWPEAAGSDHFPLLVHLSLAP